MSKNRDKPVDQVKTKSLMCDVSANALGKRNWLGHTQGAAMIDAMLLVGAPREALEVARGAVDEHLRHLRLDHGLEVTDENGMFRFLPIL